MYKTTTTHTFQYLYITVIVMVLIMSFKQSSDQHLFQKRSYTAIPQKYGNFISTRIIIFAKKFYRVRVKHKREERGEKGEKETKKEVASRIQKVYILLLISSEVGIYG
ncbi:uncharacterized protein LOC116846863 isoform X5 [Odontomachus brunneus]|uniref:uncharacterized protein LOC116846863 isoform X5 n=1 Tax=Odontomachus brunneus TaxID=486640 RepID=UPI0013F294AE|nr:uncharacterized protein LOC116846863 isoform X5 [Odontomachus brunneus]